MKLSIDFSRSKKAPTKYKKVYNIVEKDVKGTIIYTDKFEVYVEGTIYSLTEDSFDNTKFKIVYCRYSVNGKRLVIIKHKGKKFSNDNYYPFSVGCGVTGNLIRVNGEIIYKLKKVHRLDTVISRRLLKQWLDNQRNNGLNIDSPVEKCNDKIVSDEEFIEDLKEIEMLDEITINLEENE